MSFEQQVIYCFSQLSEYIYEDKNHLEESIKKACLNNPWFTAVECKSMLNQIANTYCNKDILSQWLKQYSPIKPKSKNVGLIAAGNIPLVAFHDILCIIASGNTCQLKLSEKDQVLYHWLHESLKLIDLEIAQKISIVEKLSNYDAVIATGSSSSSNLFQSYFKQVPHIIRSHRNAIAVLDGSEDEIDFVNIGKDIFQYYGLGCRNVSKIYVPFGYNFSNLIRTLDINFEHVNDHTKYKNNYDYNFALCIMNRPNFYQGNTLLLVENKSIASPIGILNFEYYTDLNDLCEKLAKNEIRIQCISAKKNLPNLNTVNFGNCQNPSLEDYADGINTMDFLLNL